MEYTVIHVRADDIDTKCPYFRIKHNGSKRCLHPYPAAVLKPQGSIIIACCEDYKLLDEEMLMLRRSTKLKEYLLTMLEDTKLKDEQKFLHENYSEG